MNSRHRLKTHKTTRSSHSKNPMHKESNERNRRAIRATFFSLLSSLETGFVLKSLTRVTPRFRFLSRQRTAADEQLIPGQLYEVNLTGFDPLKNRASAYPCHNCCVIRSHHLNVLATDFAPGEVSSPRCSLDDDLLKLEDYLCPSSFHIVSAMS